SVPAARPCRPYTLSLHDALPISAPERAKCTVAAPATCGPVLFVVDNCHDAGSADPAGQILPRMVVGLVPVTSVFSMYSVPADHVDRKSTRLNSSHVSISYAVFCL